MTKILSGYIPGRSVFRCQTKQQRMFQGVTSEKSNRYWDYRNGGVCEKYIFHTQEWRLS